jgi:hypothetical protein
MVGQGVKAIPNKNDQAVKFEIRDGWGGQNILLSLWHTPFLLLERQVAYEYF